MALRISAVTSIALGLSTAVVPAPASALAFGSSFLETTLELVTTDLGPLVTVTFTPEVFGVSDGETGDATGLADGTTVFDDGSLGLVSSATASAGAGAGAANAGAQLDGFVDIFNDSDAEVTLEFLLTVSFGVMADTENPGENASAGVALETFGFNENLSLGEDSELVASDGEFFMDGDELEFTLFRTVDADDARFPSILSDAFADASSTGTTNEIPLPAALPLFAAGLGGLGYLARRKRAA